MPKLNDIFQANLADAKTLAHAFEMLWQRELITRNQMHSIVMALIEYLPAHVMVSQRLPKSVTYINVLGKARLRVSNRSEVTVEYDYIQS
jgi:hypothetical protein